jgi:adenylylsulfate kinase
MSDKNNIHPIFDKLISKERRQHFLNQKSGVFWLTGLSGSGKSTIASQVETALFNQGYFTKVIDGDNIRTGISNNLGFSIEDRQENIRRVAEIAKLFIDTGIIVLCSFISPTRSIRSLAQEVIGPSFFHEIYIESTIDVCESRDVKGLYQKARSGLIKGFTGIDSPYEAPVSPDLTLNSTRLSIPESTEILKAYIVKHVILNS